jgi:hypothetical protein
MRQHSTADVIKAKAIVSATLETSVTSITAFLKQHGPHLITSGSRRDLSLLQTAIETLRLIETKRGQLEDDMINGYLYARKIGLTNGRP